MEELSCAGRDYLEAMLLLENSQEKVHSVDLARAMGVTRASVFRAVGSLCESGFLAMEGRLLHLTETGKAAAMANHEKQLFFEQMLQKVGVAPEQARQDACRMKHAVSDESYLCLKG